MFNHCNPQGRLPRPRRWSNSFESSKIKYALLPISLLGNVYTGYLYSSISLTGDPVDPSIGHGIRDLAMSANSLTSRDVAFALPEAHRLIHDHEEETVIPRYLSTSGANSSSTSSSSGHHGPHQHDALLFLFNAIVIGTGVLHLCSVFPKMQMSIILFVIGVIFSVIMEGFEVKNDLGVFGESYMMWMDIDPHLLLFAMLPALLAGDAMTIDTSVAKRVGKQCLYLAGPGVLINALLCAVFLMHWFNWSFLLSLVTGSILCATDPVAVVALLKELGASPQLTVQIQGESLLNDGTAIVLYTVAYDMLSGADYDSADLLMFLVKTVLMAGALGVFLGYLFFSWIRIASDRFNHASSVIQILLTLCAAYWSFVLAEGVFKMSGVLATVGSSLVLAHHMWPYVVEKDALLDFWHAFENLGNIIVFFLGGALVGAVMVHIDPVDYLNLIVVYIVLLILRAGIIFGSRPILKYLHEDKDPVTTADALVMTWGGLRGAVGLALAIQVRRGKAQGADGVNRIDDASAERVLFFVGGIAFLTTCVNASTCPGLVDWLGITSLPEAQAMLLQKFTEQVVSFSESNKNPKPVTEQLQELMTGIVTDVAPARKKNRAAVQFRASTDPAMKAAALAKGYSIQEPDEIVKDCELYRDQYRQLSDEDRERLVQAGVVLEENKALESKMMKLIQSQGCNLQLSKAVNDMFLNVVNTQYWAQIRAGNLKPGSEEADLLLTSVRFSKLEADLIDWHWVSKFGTLEDDDSEVGALDVMLVGRASQRRSTNKVEFHQASSLEQLVTSTSFNFACAFAILLNVTFVAIEEVAKGENDYGLGWILFEGLFTIIFLMEFLLKFGHLKMSYFDSTWNIFDFSLVLLGIIGFILTLIAREDASKGTVGSESRVIKVARVLRTMRFLRLFRLFHSFLGRDTLISADLAKAMRRMQTASSFIAAHLQAQKSLLKFFAGNQIQQLEDDKMCSLLFRDNALCEIARCYLQSLISVHKAAQYLNSVLKRMQPELVDELRKVRQRKKIIEQLEDFVDQALHRGAINAKNAGAILHHLQHELAHCIEQVNRYRQGVIDTHHDNRHAANHGALHPAAVVQAQPAEVVSSVAKLTDVVQPTREGDAAAGKKWPAREDDAWEKFEDDQDQDEAEDDVQPVIVGKVVEDAAESPSVSQDDANGGADGETSPEPKEVAKAPKVRKKKIKVGAKSSPEKDSDSKLLLEEHDNAEMQ